MNPDVLKYIIIGGIGLFAAMVVAYLVISNKMKGKETRYVAQLVEGTKTNSFFNMEVFYQKFYVWCRKLPVTRRYVLKMAVPFALISIVIRTIAGNAVMIVKKKMKRWKNGCVNPDNVCL